MMKFVFLLTFVTAAMAAGTGYSYSGSFAGGNGQGYGHRSGFGGNPQFIPDDFIPNFNIFRELTNNLQKQQKAIAAGAFPFLNGDGGFGGAFEGQNFIDPISQIPIVPGHFNGIHEEGNFGFGGGYSNSGGETAFAGASLGPEGFRQTAGIHPENPNIPNIYNRFGPPSGGGNYGVFTSSESFSSNINGKPTNYHRASTTINDNGKVNTYTVHNR